MTSTVGLRACDLHRGTIGRWRYSPHQHPVPFAPWITGVKRTRDSWTVAFNVMGVKLFEAAVKTAIF